MNNIPNNLLEKIKAGEVAMKPRWHFVLRGLLWAALTVVVALLAIYFFSFVLFALRESGLVFAPLFGWEGVMLFVVSSPWLLIGAVGVFLLVLYLLVSHYSFSYKKPLVYSMIGLVLVVIAVASLIEGTNLHSRAGDYFNKHEVPGLSPLYRDLDKRPPKDVTRGTITELMDEQFTLTTEAGEVYIVTLDDRTRLPRNTELTVGEAVMVFGPVKDDTVKAFGVRIDDGSGPPPPPPDGGGGDGPPKPPEEREPN